MALVQLSNQNCNYVKLLLSKHEKRLFKDVQESRNQKEPEEQARNGQFEFEDETGVEIQNQQVIDQDQILETLVQYLVEFDCMEDCVNWILEDNREAMELLQEDKKRFLL